MLGREFLLKRLKKLKSKNNQRGFTLLELLVVVAILAAIAGTATVALQDTDARAAAAAHVAMMDELNKGVNTFRVLQHNVYPNNLDSLMSYDGTDYAVLPNDDGDVLGIGDVESYTPIAGMTGVMADIGMEQLRYVNADATGTELPEGVSSCAVAELQDVISDRGNAVVAGNLFNGPDGNGCGESIEVGQDTDADDVDDAFADIAVWNASVERILGPGEYGDAAFSGGVMTSSSGVEEGVEAPILMAVGFGPASDLFNTSNLGAMTSVPVYRHVNPDQYNRFIGLFKVGQCETTATDTWGAPTAVDQVLFVGVVDGAGDTKEEELGEWDGTRNTI